MRTCYGCKYFDVTTGAHGYSEYTPGWDWSMNCFKDHWSFDGFEDGTNEFGKKLDTANTCADYEQREN